MTHQNYKACPNCRAPLADNAEYCICGHKNQSVMDDLLDIWGIKNEMKEDKCDIK